MVTEGYEGLTAQSSGSLNAEQIAVLTDTLVQEKALVVASADDIVNWPVGLTLVDPEGLPVGHLACKMLFERVVKCAYGHHGEYYFAPREFALIGGMYINPAYRNKGLGKAMLKQVTGEVFTKYPDVSSAVANCNSLSAPVFEAVGYYKSRVNCEEGKILPQRPGKATYQMARNMWESADKPDLAKYLWHSTIWNYDLESPPEQSIMGYNS